MFRLALQLGRTFAELCDTLTVAEFQQWVEFYSLEPWGSEAAFLRSGVVASTIANVNRDPKRKAQPWSPADFVPDFSRKKKKGLDPKLVRQQLVEAFGGKVTHGKRKDGVRRRQGDGVLLEGVGSTAGEERGEPGIEGGGETDHRGSKKPRAEKDP